MAALTLDPPATEMQMTGMAANQDAGSPLRRFLRTETGSAGILLAAVAVAMVWASVSPTGYAATWSHLIPIRLGPWSAAFPARTWINSGLMTFFFLVVGLEARREFDLGELRDRRRTIVPLLAGLAGMALPVAIFLVINAGGSGAAGWGAAMSSDTALALGTLSVVARRIPASVRTFLLTMFVVDDIAALVVIAVAYSQTVRLVPTLIAAGAYAALLASRRLDYRLRRLGYLGFGVLSWGALMASGIDPVVAGLLIGIATSAYTPSRGSLEQATTLVRRFREQPGPESAHSATVGLTAVLSANTRLQYQFHPWTSRVVVPLFALANAGVAVSGTTLARLLTSPIALGIVVAYVLGKPVGILGASWLIEKVSHASVRPQVGWGAVAGSGVTAGIGFTVSLLVVDLAFTGPDLQVAKLGIVTAAVFSAIASWLVFHVLDALPQARRVRALDGRAEQLTDLVDPVDTARDHIVGATDAAVTVVEYGDYECPWTAMASPTAHELIRQNPDIRYVWRHLPLTDIHPNADLAAQASEAAAAQGMFWPMHTMLLEHQDDLGGPELGRYAQRLGLDLEQFHADLAGHRHAMRVARDIDSADASGVAGTPTFFINGARHEGPQDLATLTEAIATARARSAVLDFGRTAAAVPTAA